MEDNFPIFKMFILSTAVFASAVSLSGLFPYVGFMVIYLHKAKTENEAGFYSGYIASSMMFGRLVSSFLWGQLADKWGRKPVMICGCLSIVIFSITFGLSTTFELALLSRFLLGLTNPIWGIAKTLVSEVCSAKHEAKGMGLTTGCWSLGLVVGPAYGGMLANPTQLYPHIFGGTIFDTYPYLLPNAITAAFGLIGCIFLIIFFPETLPQSTANHTILPSSPTISTQSLSSNSTTTTTTTTTTSSSSETRGASIIELCSLPGVIPVLFAYLAISFSSICFDEIIPLWSMATHPHGGLELQQVLIGTMLTITGVVLTIYTFVVYPVIAQNLGRNRSFQYSQIFLALLVPCTTFLHKLSPSSRARFPLLILMYTLSKASCSLGFASIALILNHCVSKDKRGSLNGLSMTFGSIAKSIGPLFAAVVFAWSIQVKRIPPLDYHLVFLIISCSSILSLFIPLPSEHSQSHSQSESQTIIQQQQNQKEQNQEEGEDNNESIEMIEVRKNQRENNKEKNITSSITDFIGGFIYGQKGYQSLTTEEADEMDEEQHK